MIVLVIVLVVIVAFAAIAIIYMHKNFAKQLELSKNQISTEASIERIRIETELEKAQDKVKDLIKEKDSITEEYKKLQEDKLQLQGKLSSAETRLEEQKKQNLKHDEQSKQQMQLLREQFENTSQSLLKERQEDFAKSNKQTMDNLMSPMLKELENVRKEISEVKSASDKNTSSLQGAFNVMVEHSKTLGKEAENLANALHNKGKVQGDWGEHVLDSILAGSGLREGYEFEKQKCFTGAKNTSIRPDVIINCADGSHIIVDSKVTITAFYDYLAAENDEEREAAKKSNWDSVLKHVKELSNAEYHKYVPNSINYVMMFVPNEGAYLLAMNYDNDLAMKAYKMGVIILNPTNLMLTLHLVLQAWHNSRQEDNCKEILDIATKMYDKFANIADNYEKLGKQLNTAINTYHDTEGQLLNGRGNLATQMESMKKLGINTTKTILDNSSVKAITSSNPAKQENVEDSPTN